MSGTSLSTDRLFGSAGGGQENGGSGVGFSGTGFGGGFFLFFGNEVNGFDLFAGGGGSNETSFIELVGHPFAPEAITILKDVDITTEDKGALFGKVLGLGGGGLDIPGGVVDVDVPSGGHDSGFGVGFLDVGADGQCPGVLGLDGGFGGEKIGGNHPTGDRRCETCTEKRPSFGEEALWHHNRLTLLHIWRNGEFFNGAW